jgi:hypothetical protein
MVYSRFTGNHYCCEVDACGRRADRTKQKLEQDRERILGNSHEAIEQRIGERVLRAAAGVGLKLSDEQSMVNAIGEANHYAMKRESR